MGQEVSLQGWDTANVVTLDVLNAAIVAQKTTPPSFSLNDGTISIAGTWGPWQVTPGRTGDRLEVQCPIASGTGDDGSGQTVTLAGASLNVEIKLATLDDPSYVIADKTAVPLPAKTPATVLKPNTASTAQDPAVTVISITPRSLRNPYQFAFEDWFNANIGDFKHIFYAIMLGERAATGDFQWLKPTGVSYAMATTVSGKQSVFAALCQTDGDSYGNLAQQIDPAVVANLPAGCNSVLAISGEKFAEHILKPGAQKVLKGSALADFDIVGNGLAITNNKELTWLDMKLQDGLVVSPKIPKGNFRLRVVEDQLELEFTQMSFSHPLLVGNDDFTLSFTQYLNIELGTNGKGLPVLTPVYPYTVVNGQRVPIYVDKSVITVNPDQQAVDFKRAMGIASIALSILPVGVGLFKAGAWALKAGSALASRIAAAARAGSSVVNVTVDASEVAQLTDASLVGTDNLAAAAAFSAGRTADAGISVLVNRVAMISGIWSAITGIAAAAIKLQTNGDADIKDAPSVDTFVANVLSASQWPGAKGWELKTAELAQSLLLHGALKTS